jgi:hypothetical protein
MNDPACLPARALSAISISLAAVAREHRQSSGGNSSQVVLRLSLAQRRERLDDSVILQGNVR